MKRIFCLLSILPLLAYPVRTVAQTGILTGRVTEAETEDPVMNAIVLVVNSSDTTKQQWVYTAADGRYTFGDLPSAEYRVRFISLAHREQPGRSIAIEAGVSAVLDAELVPKVILIEGIVVSASRSEQKVLDAPASVTVVDAKRIAQTPGTVPTDHVRSVGGVDVAQTGLLQQNLVVRGFNNVFSGTCMMLTDNRLAGVPSLRLNAPYLIPIGDDDIERIEVVRGPASALYGPNASNGVVNFITYSPLSSQGTSVSTVMGERSLFQGTLRHAGSITPEIGYKISGLYFRGNDWSYVDPVESAARQDALNAGADPRTLKIGKRDGVIERYSAEARMDFLVGDEFSAVATAGITELGRGIELTDLGAAQGRDWRYTYVQGRISYGDLFAQAFLNLSDAGHTYLLRSGESIVDRSTQFVGQAQHSLRLGESQRFVYGADFLLTRPETDGTINGRNEGSDNVTEYGAYLQSETNLLDNVNLVLAGRFDRHGQLNDLIFSPRAGITVKPHEEHVVRLTFNRAYSTPTPTDLFLDLESVPNVFGFPSPYEVSVRAIGVPKSGFTFERDAGGRPLMYSQFNPLGPIPVDYTAILWPAVVQVIAAGGGPDLSAFPAPSALQVGAVMALLNPETSSFDLTTDAFDIAALKPTITQTVELGYKGVLFEKLQASVDVYYSHITNFIGPLQIFTPNVFLNSTDVKNYLKPLIKQAYMDGGVPEPQAEAMAESESTQLGASIGQIPMGTVTPKEAANKTSILLGVRNFGEVDVQGVDLWADYRLSSRFSIEGTFSYVNKNFFEKLDGVTDLALNAPRSKGSFAVNYRNGELGFSANVRYRWTDGFRMSSGVYVGTVKAASFVDATVGYDFHSMAGLRATLMATNLLKNEHQYFIGAPAIGRMIAGRLAYSF